MRAFAAALLIAFAGAALGEPVSVDRPDPRTEDRLKALAEELRCLVCQNQTIADSNAPLAVDLRNQIRGQIAEGRSDDQIRGYMVERYGDFVLYKPPFHAATALLWVGPFALLAIGAGVFLLVIRRQRNAPSSPPSTPNPHIVALLEQESPSQPSKTRRRKHGSSEN